MDLSLLVNVFALVLSVLALVVSSITALKQYAMMRHANEVPILVDLMQEFRTDEFQQSETYVIERLAAEHDPDLGCSRLPDEPRLAVNAVTAFFSGFGALVAMRMADDALVVPLIGYRANRAWIALEPFIRRERELRGPNDGVRYLLRGPGVSCTGTDTVGQRLRSAIEEAPL
ncbi:hypothetical protein ABT158_47995 [Nonomuraea sp. NPDC001636]|uniref:hypothetical protein n=1 Tax=Nonomuraea sp. NPDC001636 TaxID=3154391 RepID=UPI00332562B2